VPILRQGDNEKSMKIYKIRHKQSGLFSEGGSSPFFGQNGKIYTQIGHIKNHLHHCEKYNSYRMTREDNWREHNGYLEDIEIVEYELAELEILNLNDIGFIKNEK